MGGPGSFFGWQLIGCIAIIAWTASLSGLFFIIMKKTDLLRVSVTDEVLGLDFAEMDFYKLDHINEKVLDF